jgi:peptidoglycan/xylan/chitin deacetylase (PgdA/CDA1 family)
VRWLKILAVLLLFAGIGAGVWREFVHTSNIKPALVTPAMNVHNEFSADISARVYRYTHEHIAQDRSSRPKLIALTFDDGPYPVFTPLLLDVLHELHVPATFFLIGRDAEQWPELTRRIEADGHEIADHTYSHPNLDEETPEQVRDELEKGRDVLWPLVHDPSVRTLMRPPHGRYNEDTLRAIQSTGYQVVLWTYDSGDWRTLSTAEIEAGVIDHATAPDIVLLHSGKLATIDAIPKIVERFRAAGYEFVTAGELLRRVQPFDINHPGRRQV